MFHLSSLYPVTPTTSAMFEELEGSYLMYSSSLRILMQQEKNFDKIRRTFCWDRLARLHKSLPQRYQDPHHLYSQYMLDIAG
jgi:hypothetical protein